MSDSFNSFNSVYDLYIWLDSEKIPWQIMEKYKSSIYSHNQFIESYLEGSNVHIDAGIDLFVPCSVKVGFYKLGIKIDHGFKAAMYFNNRPCAYYLYPRSSMGSKTPLRLSNSVGIIDAGYRGNIIGLFDNISSVDFSIDEGIRLLQICSPNLTYPIRVTIVDDASKLGLTQRNDGGFGSTGR